MRQTMKEKMTGDVKRRLTPDETLLDETIVSLHQAQDVVRDNRKEYPDPIDYLKRVMKEQNMRNRDLKIYLGSSGTVCSVLKRRKPLSLRMIRNLNKYLHIPAEILIQPYDCH